MVRRVPSGDRDAVARAVALLRLAKALDQARRGSIEDVMVRRSGSTIKLQLRARRSAELELWALDKERNFFREVFGYDLIVGETERSAQSGTGRRFAT
jgi:exopolyphosphatase/guanosine-5'-triphosphate,3'-diphosphate pyrophosphatase